jgi:hypothetical protein
MPSSSIGITLLRSPSPRVLKNRVSLFAAIGGPDIDGGPQYVYSPVPTISNQPASVQYIDAGEVVDELNRVSQVNFYKIIFAVNVKRKPRDKIVWVESGVTHNLIVQANPPSEAGRDSAFIVRAQEYL